jgi:polyisoprenoid-binding protein YceI
MYFILTLLISSAFSQTFTTTSGQIEFDAVGNPKKLLIHGKSGVLGGRFVIAKQLLTGESNLDLSTLETGMAMRDRHMKEKYLEVDKFKTASLTVESIVLTGNTMGSIKGVKFDGKLNLHGVEKSVHGTVDINHQDDLLNLDANFLVNTKDFNIDTPSFAGLTVAEEVNVRAKFEAKIEKKAQ